MWDKSYKQNKYKFEYKIKIQLQKTIPAPASASACVYCSSAANLILKKLDQKQEIKTQNISIVKGKKQINQTRK